MAFYSGTMNLYKKLKHLTYHLTTPSSSHILEPDLLFGFSRATPIPRVNHHVGSATWYKPGLGSCGVVNKDTDFVVALSAAVFDRFGKTACGRRITARIHGKSVTVRVKDRCVGCATGDIDLSPAAFSVLADLSVGRIHGVRWSL